MMESSSSARNSGKKHSSLPDPEVVPFGFGNAATVIFLLQDYETFGLGERVRKESNNVAIQSFFTGFSNFVFF